MSWWNHQHSSQQYHSRYIQIHTHHKININLCRKSNKYLRLNKLDMLMDNPYILLSLDRQRDHFHNLSHRLLYPQRQSMVQGIGKHKDEQLRVYNQLLQKHMHPYITMFEYHHNILQGIDLHIQMLLNQQIIFMFLDMRQHISL